eukprot:CAMPEP_0184020576 /NCGR_PEP_ID=MMETSP0954-20121128/9423_1 /TAXON_ID=627963 /ORGANISM="Aplanochytrium sp, Strain PBS07" /LENGTH=402 /DNA_ID=CAMNT_0026302447 /DNA_START=161 /DNA_END=1369 /DNA_ORIENTATION=-
MTWVQIESSDGEKRRSWIWLPSSKYRDLKYVASGGFGEIYTASVVQLQSNNSVVALKKIPLEPRRLSNRLYGKILAKLRNRKAESSSMSSYEEAKNEVEMMKAVQGNNYILNYYDSFSIGRQYWIATEFAKFGDLREIVQYSDILEYNDYNEEGHLGLPLQKSLPIDLLMYIMAPIFDAVRFLHSNGIIHRDIKEDNILVTEAGVPKLCDFGTACKYNGIAIPYDSSYVGTESYSPPEIIQKKEYDTKVDVWALGVTMLSLHFCGWPFTHEFSTGGLACVREFLSKDGGYELSLKSEYFGEEGAIESLHEFVRLQNFESTKQYIPTQWKEFERFLKRIIVYNSDTRPSMADLCEDELLKPVIRNWNKACEKMDQDTQNNIASRFLKIAEDSYDRKRGSLNKK